MRNAGAFYWKNGVREKWGQCANLDKIKMIRDRNNQNILSRKCLDDATPNDNFTALPPIALTA